MKIEENFQTFIESIYEISASDARTDEDSIQTVISGKREMAYLVITEQRIIDPRGSIAALREAINRGLQLIPLRGRDEGVAFLVYRRDEARARKFARFIETKGGYLNDETAEEAQFIGQMLDYAQSDIAEYIKRRYGK
jgi:hypothetical protein